MTDTVTPKPNHVKDFLKLVAFEHSVFALPFAYLSTLTVMTLEDAFSWWVLVLVTIAMVSARTLAMAANRIIDRKIDALNPRTAKRELVTGRVSLNTAYIGCAVSLAALLVSAGLLNPLCLWLSPLAVAPLVVYPYAKRFTNYPHAILGLAQMVAPVGAWLAVTGTFEGSAPAIVLGAAVGLWIGGFDLIYACQDTEVDREIGVHSTPARWGVKAALHASTVTHVLAWAAFAWFGTMTGYSWLYWTGLAVVAVALAYEHRVVRPDDLSKVNRAFFTANGFVAVALFAFALADLLLR
ncbi:menaquinone biosynthesis prenyltransferase MqnP [Glycomyces algeriensis]|uniref:4-hydroxybenzoate polyprenyltransferase n=1 Tax=Glycomyces algeriensis TaxID=256037 RepID=A0A9W6G5Z4_9ACTN|nr:menaquinone biosynthesis prenyltransferase MqnP [Glycomyces algeriensis]MDA1366184.1 4-hydroxybenzoate octaprenyltransferase [Glycomyces algeriensis]MDR7349048.1 4-hydroxybenzoate polyprenyltransferase [Glycomyces algeriensis]GLI41750.1 4-hydroxybenzoate octaprenyltransferase [Glycomyces algeriensis]